MKFCDLKLKRGDRVRDRATGVCGTVVGCESSNAHDDGVRVWWDYEPCETPYDYDGPLCDWELIPRPRPRLASLNLQPGDVVRWDGKNMLVSRMGANWVVLVSSGSAERSLYLDAEMPDNFVKVAT